MLEVHNWAVYDLKESVIACRNAMRLEMPEYTQEEFEASLERAKKLAKTPNGSGHQTFLCGIRVAFDLKYPGYISPELQRYHFNDIVCSSSKMHKLIQMIETNLDMCFNKYVSDWSKAQMKALVNEYNVINEYRRRFLEGPNDPDDPIPAWAMNEKDWEEKRYQKWMEIVSNCPYGIELFMRCTTNYLQLKTIYKQRKKHKLKEDWGAFCEWIEQLPFFEEFIK